MKIKCILVLLLIVCSFSSSVYSAELAVYSNATVYNNPSYDSVALVEFPITLNRNNFEFYQPDSTDSNYYARIFAHVELLDVAGFGIDSSNTLFTVVAKTKEEAKQTDVRLFNKLSLLVQPGIYSARVTVIDVVSKSKGEFFIDRIIVEKSSPTNSINLSDVSTAFSAEYVGVDSNVINPLIYKNGYNLLINPVSVFADSDKLLHVYGEIYNLDYTDDTRTEYQLILNALDKDKNIYQMFGSRLSKKPGSSAVFVESIDIAGWKRGTYTIEVIVIDLATTLADTSYTPLSIISPLEVMLAAKEEISKSDAYNDLNLKQQIQLSTYILTQEEIKTLNNLGDKGKGNFLKAIWAEHDPTPSKNVNELRNEILKRYHYVNKYFSTNEYKTNGWNTDRGRIYMELGQWEQRNDKEAPGASNPFEIWSYHSYEGGGFTYIFEDVFGDDDYRLVHSNADGEVYSKKWAGYLQTGFFDTFER